VERWLDRPFLLAGGDRSSKAELEGGSVAVEVLQPESEVELSGGEVAGGDEDEDGVLNLGGEFGERVARAGAGNCVEFVEAELVVERERGRRGEGAGFAGAGCKGRVETGREVLRIAPGQESGDGLQGGELRAGEVLCDVDGAVVDKLLETKAGSGLGEGPRLDGVLIFGADGHDTTLLTVLHGLRSCTYWTLEERGKVSFAFPRFSPKGGMSVGIILSGVWITRH